MSGTVDEETVGLPTDSSVQIPLSYRAVIASINPLHGSR